MFDIVGATVPAIDVYAGNAFNIKDGDFLGNKVFDLTYTQGKTVNWAGVSKTIPDQLSGLFNPSTHQSSSTLILKTTADYERSFSASVSASGSSTSFSASASSTYMYHGSLFTQTDKFYGLDFYARSIFQFARLNLNNLNPTFKADLVALPTSSVLTAAQQQLYANFFTKYGTHYVEKGVYGGSATLETSMLATILEKTTQQSLSVAVSGSYNGIIRSGSFSASAAYSSNSFVSTHRSSFSFKLNAFGGNFYDGVPLKDWTSSLNTSPTLILSLPSGALGTIPLTTLKSISALVSVAGGNAQIATNFDTLVNRKGPGDPLLGSTPTMETYSTVYNGATIGSGFLVSTVYDRGNGNRGYLQTYENNSLNPTAVIAQASQHWWTGSDTWVQYASATMPILDQNHFVATNQPTSGNPLFEMKFVGWNVGFDPNFHVVSDPIRLNFGQYYGASPAGFVVASINNNGRNGPRGVVQGLTQNLVNVVGASQHYWTGSDTIVPMNSFMMPKPTNWSYRVTATITSGGSAYFANMFYLGQNFVMDPYEVRSNNYVYTAATDGFLVAYIFATSNGGRGYVNLYCYPNAALLTRFGMVARTSIHYWTGSDTWIPHNSATIPVPKGSTYKAIMTQTSSSIAMKLWFVPLRAAAAEEMETIHIPLVEESE